MQIVIDIPEQIYLNAKADILCGADILVNAIKNGTPQPKAGRWMAVVDEDDGLGNMTWHHECSICEKSGWGDFKYCPNCGAKMESEEEQ